MGYTTPSTQTASGVITTTRLNAYKTGLDYLATNKNHVRGNNNAAQSIANNTRTAINMQAERFDVGSMHNTASFQSIIQVQTGEGGKYLCGGHLEFAAVNTTGIRQVELYFNAVTIIAVQQVPAANVLQDLSVVSLWQFAAADKVEMTALQSSGGALNVNSASAYTGEAWAMWMAT